MKASYYGKRILVRVSRRPGRGKGKLCNSSSHLGFKNRSNRGEHVPLNLLVAYYASNGQFPLAFITITMRDRYFSCLAPYGTLQLVSGGGGHCCPYFERASGNEDSPLLLES